MSFPNSPTGGTTHTIGDITWEWNGYAWEVIVSTIAGLSGPKGDTGNTGNTGNTGIGISGASLSNYELILTLTNGTTLNVGYIRGETGPTGANGTGEGASAGVSTLNGLSGGVTLQEGTGISISAGSGGITIGTQDIFVRNDGDSMTGALSINSGSTISTTSLSISGTVTATANTAVVFTNFNQTISPATSSLSDFRSLNMSNRGTVSSDVTLNAVNGARIEGLRFGASQNGRVTTIRGANLIGGLVDSTSSLTGASAATVVGIQAVALSRPSGTGSGVITNAYAGSFTPIDSGQWTVTTASGINISNSVSGVTITNNIGIDIASQTRGTSTNYGIRVAASSGAIQNAAINLSDTTGTAAGGLLFGTDTNLYRSTTNTLKTDDNLVVTGTISGSNLSGTNTGDQTFFGGTAISVVTGPSGITISYTGVAGAGNTGATGPTGSPGSTGIPPGLLYRTMTIFSDPVGEMQMGKIGICGPSNLIYVAHVDLLTNDVSEFVESWDDSTNQHKGYLQLTNQDGSKQHIYGITGIGLTEEGDNGFYTQFVVIPSFTGGFTFQSNENVYAWFTRSGDKGLTGPTGPAGSGGGGAAGTKTYSVFTPLDNEPPATNYATIDTVNSISVLDFDGTTQESAIFRSMIPEGASFSNLLATLYFTASTVTGGVVWGVQWEKLTGGGISGDRFTGGVTGLATLSGATSTPVGITLSSSSYGGLTAGDPYRVKIYRDAANDADGMGGDAELLIVEIRGA